MHAPSSLSLFSRLALASPPSLWSQYSDSRVLTNTLSQFTTEKPTKTKLTGTETAPRRACLNLLRWHLRRRRRLESTSKSNSKTSTPTSDSSTSSSGPPQQQRQQHQRCAHSRPTTGRMLLLLLVTQQRPSLLELHLLPSTPPPLSLPLPSPSLPPSRSRSRSSASRLTRAS